MGNWRGKFRIDEVSGSGPVTVRATASANDITTEGEPIQSAELVMRFDSQAQASGYQEGSYIDAGGNLTNA